MGKLQNQINKTFSFTKWFLLKIHLISCIIIPISISNQWTQKQPVSSTFGSQVPVPKYCVLKPWYHPSYLINNFLKVIPKRLNNVEYFLSWDFDSSSTQQTRNTTIDTILKPVFKCPDPFINQIITWCISESNEYIALMLSVATSKECW